MKNKLPRPTKGQLPDPTYSRMKFASCTDRADSDGWGTGKKKAPCRETRAWAKGFIPSSLAFRCSLHTERQGL